nr:hypothetical protein [Scytonema hofmannii]
MKLKFPGIMQISNLSKLVCKPSGKSAIQTTPMVLTLMEYDYRMPDFALKRSPLLSPSN